MSSNFAIPDRESYVNLPRGVQPTDVQFLGRLFATDTTRIFSTRGILKGVDAASFRVLQESLEPDLDGSFASAYAVSEDAALFVDELHAPRLIKTPHPARLRVLAAHFASDSINVFHDGVNIRGADPSVFRVLSPWYSVDNANCYFLSKRIAGATPMSFRPLAATADWYLYVSADDRAVYFRELPVIQLTHPTVKVLRDDRLRVVGVLADGQQHSLNQLDAAYRQASAPTHRSVTFSESPSTVRYTENLFAGYEEELSIFLMLCTHKSIKSFEEFTRGKRGEKSVVRAIERLNHALPLPLAEISRTSIFITSEGVAAHRQLGSVVDKLTSLLTGLR
jgi:DKNYY family